MQVEKDQDVSFWLTVDADTFGCNKNKTLKERFEPLYTKLVEVSNILTSKGADPESLILVASRNIAHWLECSRSRTLCQEAWEGLPGRFNLGKIYRWEVVLDDALPPGCVEIHSNIGKKALLSILNSENI